jgi:hypothetical protein
VSGVDMNFEEDQNESDSKETGLREELMSSIRNELNMALPIFYDTYNLCNLYQQQKLSIFKVVMLR